MNARALKRSVAKAQGRQLRRGPAKNTRGHEKGIAQTPSLEAIRQQARRAMKAKKAIEALKALAQTEEKKAA